MAEINILSLQYFKPSNMIYSKNILNYYNFLFANDDNV